MKEFISRWSNWWILNPKRKQLDDAFEKELNELIEREVALRIHDVVERSEQLKAFLSVIIEEFDSGGVSWETRDSAENLLKSL